MLPATMPASAGGETDVCMFMKSVDLTLWRWRAERSSELAAFYLPPCLPMRWLTSMFKSVDITPTLWRLRAERSPEVAACYLSPCLPVRGGRLRSVCLIRSVDLTLWRWRSERSPEVAACYLPPCLPVRGGETDVCMLNYVYGSDLVALES
jgi:hypothetical protein